MAAPNGTEPAFPVLAALAVLAALPVAVYTTDPAGWITFYNEAAAALWGRRPVVGEERWCGSWRIYQANGNSLPHEQPFITRALRGVWPQRPVGFIERSDGTRTFCRSEVKLMHDDHGSLIGVINVIFDLDSLGPRRSDANIEATAEAEGHVAKLTARERQVFAGVVAGQSTKGVARSLGISPRTVEVHRQNVMFKLNAQSVAELVRLSLHVEL